MICTKTLEVFVSMIRDLLYANKCDLIAYIEKDMKTDLLTPTLFWDLSKKKTMIMFQCTPGKSYHEQTMRVDWKVHISVIDDFLDQKDPSTATPMEEGCKCKEDYVEK